MFDHLHTRYIGSRVGEIHTRGRVVKDFRARRLIDSQPLLEESCCSSGKGGRKGGGKVIYEKGSSNEVYNVMII